MNNQITNGYIPFRLRNVKKLEQNALLILQNGDFFTGYGFGAKTIGIGEICFNTSMTGYQEIITDPSYSKQIINFTFPHIGNVGTNKEDFESQKSYASGIITRLLPTNYSNWRSLNKFDEWLKSLNVPGIAGIDTRLLTKRIRESDSTNGLIVHSDKRKFDFDELKSKLAEHPSMKGLELFSFISTKKKYYWKEGVNLLLKNKNHQERKKSDLLTIVTLDFGIKKNILRNLYERNLNVIVLPENSNFNKIMSYKPSGIFLSNGPGDPSATSKRTFDLLSKLIEVKIPIFGICIGHQLLALSLGAKTKKMKQGHRGANHPVKNLENNSVEITSQNHGFYVDKDTLPSDLLVTHLSLFDDSIEGLSHKTLPIFSVQFHPEASPGPTDSSYLFDKFFKLVEKYNYAKKK